jgi:CRISPR/Cas system-associated exonuclease Cas4 (RecB family)
MEKAYYIFLMGRDLMDISRVTVLMVQEYSIVKMVQKLMGHGFKTEGLNE